MAVPFLQARDRHGEDEPCEDGASENGQATKQEEPEFFDAMQTEPPTRPPPAHLCTANGRGINAHLILRSLWHSLCYEMHCLPKLYVGALTPNVTVFGARASKRVIKVK